MLFFAYMIGRGYKTLRTKKTGLLNVRGFKVIPLKDFLKGEGLDIE